MSSERVEKRRIFSEMLYTRWQQHFADWYQQCDEKLPPTGVEPVTSALGKLRSIHLSYGGKEGTDQLIGYSICSFLGRLPCSHTILERFQAVYMCGGDRIASVLDRPSEVRELGQL